MDKPNLDYNTLLDDWAGELFLLAEEYEKKQDRAEAGSFRQGFYKGKHEATIMAITKLSMLETRKKKKYEITDSPVDPKHEKEGKGEVQNAENI